MVLMATSDQMLTPDQHDMKMMTKCKALFSISEPLLGYSSYFDNKSDKKTNSTTDEILENLIERIRNNRQSTYGPDTTVSYHL